MQLPLFRVGGLFYTLPSIPGQYEQEILSCGTNNKILKKINNHTIFDLLHDHYGQKESGTWIVTGRPSLSTFSTWLMVDKLHMPEEQVIL